MALERHPHLALDEIDVALLRGADEEALELFFAAAKSPLREGIATRKVAE